MRSAELANRFNAPSTHPQPRHRVQPHAATALDQSGMGLAASEDIRQML
jgi:hypothetical protein